MTGGCARWMSSWPRSRPSTARSPRRRWARRPAVRAAARWSCGASRARAKRAGRGSAGLPDVLVLDAGAFVAVERGDRDVVALIKRERQAGRVPVSHGGVVAQVWRGGTGRQVAVARLMAGVDIAALVCLAADGDDILTSDPGDLRALAQAAGIHVELIPV